MLRAFIRDVVILAALLLTIRVGAAAPAPKLVLGKTITITFPKMPPTFYELSQKKDVKAQMMVFLPTNYDPGRKHPLLVFLNGGDGGSGSTLERPAYLPERPDWEGAEGCSATAGFEEPVCLTGCGRRSDLFCQPGRCGPGHQGSAQAGSSGDEPSQRRI